MTKPVKQQIVDRFINFVIDGINMFPKEEVSSLRQTTNVENKGWLGISECTRCPLAQARKKVVLSSNKLQKKFFILSEFPQIEDEKLEKDCENVFSEKSASGVIAKLVKKLGIIQDSHFSYALKCHPEKGIPDKSLSICASHNLKYELDLIDPNFIFCFGKNSWSAISQLVENLSMNEISENSTVFEFAHKKIYFLSSALELEAYPQWRMQVWRFLEHLKLKVY